MEGRLYGSIGPGDGRELRRVQGRRDRQARHVEWRPGRDTVSGATAHARRVIGEVVGGGVVSIYQVVPQVRPDVDGHAAGGSRPRQWYDPAGSRWTVSTHGLQPLLLPNRGLRILQGQATGNLRGI